VPNVSVSLSDAAYEGYKSIPKGERSKVASKAYLAHNHAAFKPRFVAYENLEGERVKIPLVGKSVNDIMQMMHDQAKCIDAMQRRILEITGEEE
jgi:hypothetical protein